MPKGYVDFEDLTKSQQEEVLGWLSKLKAYNYGNNDFITTVAKHAFRIKRDGHISKAYTDRPFTDVAMKQFDTEWHNRHLDGNRPDKGDLNHLISERFTLAPEK